ncbi:LysR family transcriptional regulator [Novosphingobium mangrovi (ex Huang et al. 2023)]|uniref:LysR family transcriptional regulator n=1 Tax=Novosphingobium mangrovi (ex Huang et al. 2023) TaxID=2976432 RepID=A0ABT2I8Q1_9SPHN|nr:LysR family transcriptional regulator [Novosphingobium mangrovi (ex Huang et al. 2023)]MCT2401207.1 LysR family transcriptional regulator [Novosphingobium mangrovi (ex Huang et al. 2023)]
MDNLIPKLIDSRRLWLFYNVAHTGSFSRTEALIAVPQPAISRHIGKLEDDLNVRLLERHGRGVTLTPMGEVLFEHAGAILGEMASAVDAIELAKRQPAGRVSICASSIVMSRFMPEIMHRFMQKFPEVELTAIQAVSGQIYDQLVSGKVDVAIVISKPNTHRFEAIQLLEEPMVLIAHKSHPVAQMKVIKQSTLADLKMVLPASPNGMRGLIDAYFEKLNLSITAHLQADSVPLTVKIVGEGQFVTIMPISTFEHEFDTKNMVGIPLSPSFTRTLYAAYAKPKDGSHSSHAQALIEEVITVFRGAGRGKRKPAHAKAGAA